MERTKASKSPNSSSLGRKTGAPHVHGCGASSSIAPRLAQIVSSVSSSNLQTRQQFAGVKRGHRIP
eukprot:scaffold86727_cov60-Phaeocystis_antarctica.AAC.2